MCLCHYDQKQIRASAWSRTIYYSGFRVSSFPKSTISQATSHVHAANAATSLVSPYTSHCCVLITSTAVHGSRSESYRVSRQDVQPVLQPSRLILRISHSQLSVTFCLKFSFRVRSCVFHQLHQQLWVAQLVERETVRVAFYLEVACSTQALESPFACCLILNLLPPQDSSFETRDCT